MFKQAILSPPVVTAKIKTNRLICKGNTKRTIKQQINKKDSKHCPRERNSCTNESKGKILSLCREQKGVALQNEARNRLVAFTAKRRKNSRPQHWQAMLLPYLFGARLCSTNWAISAFALQIRFLRLRSLRESKLSHSRVQAPRSIYKQKRQLTAALKSGKRGSNSRPQPWQGCALPTELFPHT